MACGTVSTAVATSRRKQAAREAACSLPTTAASRVFVVPGRGALHMMPSAAGRMLLRSSITLPHGNIGPKTSPTLGAIRVCACPVSPMTAPLLLVSTTPPIATDPFYPARRSGIAAHGSVDKMDVIAAGRRGDEAGHQCRCLAVSSPASHSCFFCRRQKPFQLVRKLRGAVERHPESVVELAKIR